MHSFVANQNQSNFFKCIIKVKIILFRYYVQTQLTKKMKLNTNMRTLIHFAAPSNAMADLLNCKANIQHIKYKLQNHTTYPVPHH